MHSNEKSAAVTSKAVPHPNLPFGHGTPIHQLQEQILQHRVITHPVCKQLALRDSRAFVDSKASRRELHWFTSAPDHVETVGLPPPTESLLNQR